MRTKLLLAPLAAALLAAAGCGDDEPDVADSASDAAATASADGQIAVTALDYAFGDLPREAAAGSRLTLHNSSDTEVHELIAYRLPAGEERSAVELVALPEEELGALLAGPPQLGLLALPGEDGEIVAGDGTLAEPGRYLVFCAIPVGAKAADVTAAIAEAQKTEGPPPEIPGGPPHFTQGMIAEVEVG